MVEIRRTEPAAEPSRESTTETNELLADIRRRVRLPPNVSAGDALEAVMCTFSQHASGSEASYVLDALPKPSRPVLVRCPLHASKPVARFDRNELLRRMAEHLHVSPGDAEDITSAVLMTIGARLKPEEVHGIADHLPLELRDLWAVRRAAPPLEPHPVLGGIERSVALPYGVTGAAAFTAVMGTFTRRLEKAEARQFLARLPADLRPHIEPFVTDRDEAPEKFDAPRFLSRVRSQLNVDDGEPVARAVFAAVEEYLRTDVFEHVMGQLPRDLQDLWDLPEEL